MNAGRPLEFDPEQALEAAMELFWRKGYEATSLQDLLAAMGLSKSSFYQTFKSKHALFQASIRHYRRMLDQDLTRQMEVAGSGKAFLQNLFQHLVVETRDADARKGCLLMNTASEFAQNDPRIAAVVAQGIESLRDIFETAIRQSQEQGEIPVGQDARALATYLVSSMSGIKNMIKAGADKKTVREIAGLTLRILD
ncbi:MAG: TetR/AcrR family transcriptional regulator [Gammaproteobacteria bacterium]